MPFPLASLIYRRPKEYRKKNRVAIAGRRSGVLESSGTARMYGDL